MKSKIYEANSPEMYTCALSQQELPPLGFTSGMRFAFNHNGGTGLPCSPPHVKKNPLLKIRYSVKIPIGFM